MDQLPGSGHANMADRRGRSVYAPHAFTVFIAAQMFSVFHFGLTANNAHTLSTDPDTPLRSHVRFHLRQSLTWGFAFLLTAVPAAFVSRSASFRTGRGQMNRHPCDRAAVNGFRPSPPSLTRCRRAATVSSTEAASLRTYGDASRHLVTELTVDVDVEARSNPQRDCDGVIHGPPREPACLFVTLHANTHIGSLP